MNEPIRLMIFPDKPECLLVMAPGGLPALPALASPFTAVSIGEALGEHGIDYRLTEGHPGRWTQSVVMLRKAAGAERAQRAKQREIAELGLVSSDERSEVTRQKMETDETIRALKKKIGDAKTKLRERGQYTQASVYRGLEERLDRAKVLSQALQVRLGEIRRKEAEENREASRGEAEAFRSAAHETLTEEQLEAVLAAMEGA